MKTRKDAIRLMHENLEKHFYAVDEQGYSDGTVMTGKEWFHDLIMMDNEAYGSADFVEVEGE